MRGRSAALAAALASVLAAAPVMAQPKSANRPPQDVANDLVKQAITKSQQGDHLAAIDLYLSAYSLIPQHTLLSNVGNEYQEAGKPVEALKYFCMYLDKDPTGTNATYAASKARALQIELGNKNVDEKSLCKPPKKTKPKEEPEKEKEKAKEEPPKEEEDVSGTKGLDKPAHHEKKKESPSSPGGTLKIAGIAMGVVGLGGVGLGTYYGMKAQEKSDILSNHNPAEPWPDNIRDIEADGEKLEKRQIYVTIAGGALTATGVVLFIMGATKTAPAEKSDKLSIRPTATPSSIGLAIGRGF